MISVYARRRRMRSERMSLISKARSECFTSTNSTKRCSAGLFGSTTLSLNGFLSQGRMCFVGAAQRPLAGRASVSLDDLAPFPRLSYEQGDHNSFYFSEEILSTLESKKDIMVRDRATLFNLLIGLNGYTICSGVK